MEIREKTQLTFEPERGQPETGPVEKFELRKITERQHRARNHHTWLTDHRDVTVLASGLSRRTVETLIVNGTGWLAYMGEDG